MPGRFTASYERCMCFRQHGHILPRCGTMLLMPLVVMIVMVLLLQDKTLADYNPADISMALCRMVSYNIGQLAYLNAMRYGINRILFGGFFIRGHPYTMETISYAIKFWSKVGAPLT